MSVQMIQAFKSIQATPTQRLVAYMLADACNEKTGRCDPSVATLVDLTGLSNRTIITAIFALEKAGHLSVKRRGGSRSRYQLHPRARFTGEAGSPVQEVHGSGEAASPPPVKEVHRTSEAGSHEPELTGSLTGTNPTLQQDQSDQSDRSDRSDHRMPNRAQSWPTLHQVIAYGQLLMAPADCATRFWNDCEAVGWVNRSGVPIHDWRPLFRNYATRWKANESRAPSRTGSNNGQRPKHPAYQRETATLGLTASDIGTFCKDQV